MKKLLLLSIIMITIIFSSCDGKDRALENVEERLAKSDLPTSFFEQTNYFPEDYTEVITDTILSNGYRVEIKNFTDMNSSVLKEFTKDSITYKHYYRDFLSSISIWKDDKEILFRTIDKDFFETSSRQDSFLKETTFHNIWLDEETATMENKIVINSLFCKPKTNDCIVYKMIVGDTGNFTIKKEI